MSSDYGSSKQWLQTRRSSSHLHAFKVKLKIQNEIWHEEKRGKNELKCIDNDKWVGYVSYYIHAPVINK